MPDAADQKPQIPGFRTTVNRAHQYQRVIKMLRKMERIDQPIIEAMVRYNASGYHRHRLSHIQPQGAFMEMGNVRVLRKDTPVQVVFVHREAGRSHTHRLEAKVDRIENNGALLRFVELDEPAQLAISRLQGTR